MTLLSPLCDQTGGQKTCVANLAIPPLIFVKYVSACVYLFCISLVTIGGTASCIRQEAMWYNERPHYS